jgi:hypothetical protein
MSVMKAQNLTRKYLNTDAFKICKRQSVKVTKICCFNMNLPRRVVTERRIFLGTKYNGSDIINNANMLPGVIY